MKGGGQAGQLPGPPEGRGNAKSEHRSHGFDMYLQYRTYVRICQQKKQIVIAVHYNDLQGHGLARPDGKYIIEQMFDYVKRKTIYNRVAV